LNGEDNRVTGNLVHFLTGERAEHGVLVESHDVTAVDADGDVAFAWAVVAGSTSGSVYQLAAANASRGLEAAAFTDFDWSFD
jgi:hypothetical protein